MRGEEWSQLYRTVVFQVREFVERLQEKVFEAADSYVSDLLEKAQINLTRLQIITTGLRAACRKGGKTGFLRARARKQKHSQIAQVQKEAASIKNLRLVGVSFR